MVSPTSSTANVQYALVKIGNFKKIYRKINRIISVSLLDEIAIEDQREFDCF